MSLAQDACILMRDSCGHDPKGEMSGSSDQVVAQLSTLQINPQRRLPSQYVLKLISK